MLADLSRNMNVELIIRQEVKKGLIYRVVELIDHHKN